MKVAIITEGFQGTGYGHLTRCLSLYQAFEEKNIVPLYIANCDEKGKKFISDVNLIKLDWLNKTVTLIEMLKEFDIAIIDSYLASFEIYEQIKKIVNKSVYIDDYMRLEYPPGIIVNGTIGAGNLPYKKFDQYHYLLGIDYMPLRKEFWDINNRKATTSEIKNVFISFGGQDLKTLTSKILNYLLFEYQQYDFYVASGLNSITNNSDKIHNYYFLSAKEMLNLMLKCDIAVSSAGQITYELARIGLPTIAVGVAKNQMYNISGWLSVKFINEEIWYDDKQLLKKIKKQIKLNLSVPNKSFVDGQGSRRIIESVMGEG